MQDLRPLLATALALPLLMTGCGGDGSGDGSEPPAEESPAAPVGDEGAIQETMTSFLLEPRCDLATDDYLVQLSLDEEMTPVEACEQFESFFVEPSYDADDILYSGLAIDGDVATIEVGSELVDITTLYQLTRVDGTWLVSGDEFNSDLPGEDG
jgi:hypothetical protein